MVRVTEDTEAGPTQVKHFKLSLKKQTLFYVSSMPFPNNSQTRRQGADLALSVHISTVDSSCVLVSFLAPTAHPPRSSFSILDEVAGRAVRSD